MVLPFLAAAAPFVSAAATLVGGKMSADASAKAARMNAIAQAVENQNTREYNERMLRETWDRETAIRLGEERLQKEFAQNGVQWRAADARAAGLHPLAAMGFQGNSYSSSVGTTAPPQATSTGASPYSGASMGSAVASAGQDISRAMEAAATQQQRNQNTIGKLQVAQNELSTIMMAADAAKKVAQLGPAFPSSSAKKLIAGQGNAPQSSRLVEVKKQEVETRDPNDRTQSPERVHDVTHVDTGRKRTTVVMPESLAESLESDTSGTFDWIIRNKIGPILGMGTKTPPGIPLKSKDHTWYMNPFTGEYRQARKSDIEFWKNPVSNTGAKWIGKLGEWSFPSRHRYLP